MKKIAKYFLVLSTMSPFLALSCTSRIETSQTKKNTTEIKNEETAKNENKLSLNENPKTNQTKKNDQKTELNSQNKEDKKTTKNDFPLETASNSAKKSSLDFTKANQNSLKINTDSLSQVSQTDFKKFSPSQTDKNSLNPIPPTYNKYQLENWGNIIKKENENTFLGQESENLNIYVLKNIAPNLVSDIKARENPYTYFNLSWGGGV